VIEVTQAEASSQMFPQAALDAAWNGREHTSIGNRSIEGFVPNGVFPTRGEDKWIAISCRSDDEWRALVAFMGSPGWAMRDEFAAAEGRAGHEDEIEERLAEWTAGRDRDELFRELQGAGVTAGPVLNAKEAAEDPHLAATGMWQRLPATADYPEVDFHTPAYHFERSDVGMRTPPALFGEHNHYVYRELLGLSEEEIARLREAGHIADTYAPEVTAPR
jgi:benzylsuccinate CoA-transferase BbsF subunit